MAEVMTIENVVIRLTPEEAQELFDVLGADQTNRADDLYDALADDGFQHREDE